MIKSEIVGHSLSPQGDELISVLCTFPRIILAEVNTHRMLSKNTSSSRAIPFNKMVESVQNDPFVPIAWQKEHKGMQGSEYFTDEKQIQAKINCWLDARNSAVRSARYLNADLIVHEIGGEDFIVYNQFDEDSLEDIKAKGRLDETKVTKQLCNRLLEPFMWTTMLITGSKEGWDNFFNLRCPQYVTWESHEGSYYKSKKDYTRDMAGAKDWTDIQWLEMNKGQAEIHIMDLAEKIYDAMNESKPIQLQAGEWHIPFRDKLDYGLLRNYLADNNIMDMDTSYKTNLDNYFVKISTAMVARTSYTVVGEEKDIDYKKMIELHDRLLSQEPPHSSPLEHCARAMSDKEYYEFFKGRLKDPEFYNGNGWCFNLKGFIPYRYMIDNNYK